MIYFSATTTGFYDSRIHTVMPKDVVELSDDYYSEVLNGQALGQRIIANESGMPVLITPQPQLNELLVQIDNTADAARAHVAGDPLRAVEYDRARIEAEQFAAANYLGDVPPMVAAWAINGRTAREAADDILHEAAQYTAALVQLREVRLAAKEQIRILMAAGEVEQAQQVVEQTVAAIEAIEAVVAGVGNAQA